MMTLQYSQTSQATQVSTMELKARIWPSGKLLCLLNTKNIDRAWMPLTKFVVNSQICLKIGHIRKDVWGQIAEYTKSRQEPLRGMSLHLPFGIALSVSTLTCALLQPVMVKWMDVWRSRTSCWLRWSSMIMCDVDKSNYDKSVFVSQHRKQAMSRLYLTPNSPWWLINQHNSL